ETALHDVLRSSLLGKYWELGRMRAELGPIRIDRHGARVDVTVPVQPGPTFRFGHVGVLGFLADRVPLIIRSGELATRSKVVFERMRLEHEFGDGASVEPVTATDVDTGRLDVTFLVNWRWPWQELRWLLWP